MNSWNVFVKLFAFVYICQTATSVLIVPSPTVIVESATSTSITISWTMPTNELYDYFSLEIHTPGVPARNFALNQTRYTIDNLTPGYLHTFIVAAVRGDMISNRSSVIQDTVPLPPSNLRLESFQSMILSMEGVFGTIHFTLREPGIQATWEGPNRGACDCYDVNIDPNDGKVARPALNEREKSSRTVRQFIQLVPGQTYTVTVRSTTCGHGFLGVLVSEAINATITLPPSSPPPVIPIRTTNTTTYLSWEKGIIPGIYDGFEAFNCVVWKSSTDDGYTTEYIEEYLKHQIKMQANKVLPGSTKVGLSNIIAMNNVEGNFFTSQKVIPLTNPHSRIIIHAPTDPLTRGRNITGLMPCLIYNFSVYTLNRGQRSETGETAKVLTRANPITKLKVTNFNETFISLVWRYLPQNGTAAYRVVIENFGSFLRPPSTPSASISGLISGTLYNISVTAQCKGPSGSESTPLRISQITIPLRPERVSAICASTVPDDAIFKARPASIISISWAPPKNGGWDLFVVDFSPYNFKNFTAVPTPPISLPQNTYELNITVPATGRIFSVFVRSARQHLLSRSTSTDANCRDEKGISIRRCRAKPTSYKITIEVYNRTHFFIEITGIRIRNITIGLSGTGGDKFVTTATRFFFINPCNQEVQRNLIDIIFYPLCAKDQLCNPIKRKLCASILKDENREIILGLKKATNACCNGKAFNNYDRRCCHNQLTDIFDRNSQCCYTRWYDRTRQKCCGINQNGGIVRPVSKSCL